VKEKKSLWKEGPRSSHKLGGGLNCILNSGAGKKKKLKRGALNNWRRKNTIKRKNKRRGLKCFEVGFIRQAGMDRVLAVKKLKRLKRAGRKSERGSTPWPGGGGGGNGKSPLKLSRWLKGVGVTFGGVKRMRGGFRKCGQGREKVWKEIGVEVTKKTYQSAKS